MKNFMDFKTFSVNEEYYNDFSSIRDKERSTEIGKRLEAARSRVRDDIRSSRGYGERTNRIENLDSANWFFKQTLAGVLGLGAAAADLFGKKKDKDKDSREKKDPQKDFEGWREDLGPTTTEKDLEKFAEKSEKVAVKRYGKDWSYDSPKTEDQKKFADMIKKGENEIVKRMKRK
jgi:hypothetical protein